MFVRRYSYFDGRRYLRPDERRRSSKRGESAVEGPRATFGSAPLLFLRFFFFFSAKVIPAGKTTLIRPATLSTCEPSVFPEQPGPTSIESIERRGPRFARRKQPDFRPETFPSSSRLPPDQGEYCERRRSRLTCCRITTSVPPRPSARESYSSSYPSRDLPRVIIQPGPNGPIGNGRGTRTAKLKAVGRRLD